MTSFVVEIEVVSGEQRSVARSHMADFAKRTLADGERHTKIVGLESRMYYTAGGIASVRLAVDAAAEFAACKVSAVHL